MEKMEALIHEELIDLGIDIDEANSRCIKTSSALQQVEKTYFDLKNKYKKERINSSNLYARRDMLYKLINRKKED